MSVLYGAFHAAGASIVFAFWVNNACKTGNFLWVLVTFSIAYIYAIWESRTLIKKEISYR